MAYNILIVDDSPAMRKVMIKILKMSQYPIGEFYEASHGEEALQVCGEQWIDVILTDLNMPVMDGMTLLERLRDDEVLRNIPTVVVSTEGRPAVIEQIRKLGIVEYISKPFQPELIAETLENLLGTDHETIEHRDTETFDF